MTNPIKSPDTSNTSQQVEDISTITGIPQRTRSQPVKTKPIAPIARNINYQDVSSVYRVVEYKGVEIRILTGDYANQTLFLGTDINKVSMSQSANWEEKQGQRMRVGINFVNISPREINFSVDIYDPNDDISPIVENIAHIQEITESAGNVPPFLSIKMGDTIYNNAVSTTYQAEYSEPLPTISQGGSARSGGYRRAVVQLGFKVAGGQGNSYSSAQPFNLETQMKSVYESKTQAQIAKQGIQAKAEVLLSDCLSQDENENLQAAIENDTLGDVDTYLAMPSELFLQLATAGLPKRIINDPKFSDRLRREMSVKFAKQQPSTGHSFEQIASSLFTGDAPPNPPKFDDFPKLLIAFDDALKAIADDSFDSLTGTLADRELLKASRCGRSIRDNGGLKDIAEKPNVDPSFTAANIGNFLGNKEMTNARVRELFGLGDRVGDDIIEEIKKHAVFETKQEFISFVGERVGGMSANVAWAKVEQSEQNTLEEINAFVKNNDTEAIKKRFKLEDGSENQIAEAIAGKTFASKQEFLTTIFNLVNNSKREKNRQEYTLANSFDIAGKYWVNFTLQQQDELSHTPS